MFLLLFFVFALLADDRSKRTDEEITAAAFTLLALGHSVHALSAFGFNYWGARLQAAPVADLTMTLSALYPVSMFLALDGNCTAYCVCAFPLIFYGAQRRRLLRGKWIFVFTDVQCMLFGMDGIGAVTWALQNSAGGNNRWPAGFIVAFVYALTPALVFAICVRFRLREDIGPAYSKGESAAFAPVTRQFS